MGEIYGSSSSTKDVCIFVKFMKEIMGRSRIQYILWRRRYFTLLPRSPFPSCDSNYLVSTNWDGCYSECRNQGTSCPPLWEFIFKLQDWDWESHSSCPCSIHWWFCLFEGSVYLHREFTPCLAYSCRQKRDPSNNMIHHCCYGTPMTYSSKRLCLWWEVHNSRHFVPSPPRSMSPIPFQHLRK